jgi:hypothetical protein
MINGSLVRLKGELEMFFIIPVTSSTVTAFLPKEKMRFSVEQNLTAFSPKLYITK